MAQTLERRGFKSKAREVDEIVRLLDQHEVIAVASLYKVRAAQLQELAKRFRSQILMKVAKNVLVKRALERSEKRKFEELAEKLTGSNILLFTDINPFKLVLLLNRNKIRIRAKAGDIAQDSIVIPSGNTGLPPGPAISELNDVGVRTRIETGSVWVFRDTEVAKEGDVIQPKLASVLSKLGIKPLEVGLQIITAYEDGYVFTGDELTLDLESTRLRFEEAHAKAFNLSMNACYPTVETMGFLLARAYSEARSLAINSAYLTTEVAVQVLAKAYRQMIGLANEIAEVNVEAAPNNL